MAGPSRLGPHEENQSLKALYIVLAIMLVPTMFMLGCDGSGSLPYGERDDSGIMPPDFTQPVPPPTDPAPPTNGTQPPPPPPGVQPPDNGIPGPPPPPIL